MKLKIIYLFLFFCISINSFSQKLNLLYGVNMIHNRNSVNVTKGYISIIDTRGLNDLINNKYPYFISELPSNEFGEPEDFEFVQFDLLTFDFEVLNSKNNRIDYQKGKYYSVLSKENSKTGAFSFYKDKFMGIFGDKNGNNYNIGILSNNVKNMYLTYKDADIRDMLNIYCDTEDPKDDNVFFNTVRKSISERSQKCINIYIEADYALFKENGKSISNTVDYILGLFAETSFLYKKEGINIKVSKIKVWDTPDNYSTTASHEALEQFRSKNSESDVDLNMLLALGANGLGGVAYLNALCNISKHYAYANININYRNVPLYSWSAMVITHELGHNLGSSHTHACRWNGNGTQIDDCGNIYVYNSGGTPEGNSCFDPDNPIIPLDGGTIMSYCHLVGAAGINLSKGFGQQPGDYIRNKVANASCLDSCLGFGDDNPIADFKAENVLTCEGGEVTFFDKTLNHPSDWIWIFDKEVGADTLYHKYPVMKYNSVGVYDVELIASNIKGHDTLKRLDYITVIEGPKADFDYEFIEKDKVQFDNKSVNSTSYFWKFGDGRISLLENPKHKYKEGGKYLVELWAKKDSCNTDNYFSDSIEIKIPLKAKFTYNTTDVCVGDTIFFKVGDNKFDSVKWIFEGANINESFLEEIKVIYDSTGIFDVGLIAFSKYGNDTLLRNDLIKVIGKPQGDFVFETKNDTVIFINTFNGDSFYWDFGDDSISTDKNPTHIYNTDGNYKVRLIVKNSCDSSVLIKSVIINTTKIEKIERNNILIYPNPAKDFIYLMNNIGFNNNSIVYITDVLGNTILKKYVREINNNGSAYHIDLRHLSKGVYFLKIEIGGNIYIKKIILN